MRAKVNIQDFLKDMWEYDTSGGKIARREVVDDSGIIRHLLGEDFRETAALCLALSDGIVNYMSPLGTYARADVLDYLQGKIDAPTLARSKYSIDGTTAEGTPPDVCVRNLADTCLSNFIEAVVANDYEERYFRALGVLFTVAKIWHFQGVGRDVSSVENPTRSIDFWVRVLEALEHFRGKLQSQ